MPVDRLAKLLGNPFNAVLQKVEEREVLTDRDRVDGIAVRVGLQEDTKQRIGPILAHKVMIDSLLLERGKNAPELQMNTPPHLRPLIRFMIGPLVIRRPAPEAFIPRNIAHAMSLSNA